MSERKLYISKTCKHCKILLIGIHKYTFIRLMFTYIDVGKEQYPDYIKSVPSLVTNGNIIKGEQVFNYINNLVQQLVKQNPELQTYMDQLDSQNRSNDQSNNQSNNQSNDQPESQSNKLPEGGECQLDGWCLNGACNYSTITDSNDNCAKRTDPLLDINPYSFISDSNDNLTQTNNTISKLPIEQDNTQFQKSVKQQQMDSSYERLMQERQLIK